MSTQCNLCQLTCCPFTAADLSGCCAVDVATDAEGVVAVTVAIVDVDDNSGCSVTML